MKKSINAVLRYYKGANVKVTLSLVNEDDNLNYVLKVEKYTGFNRNIVCHYYKSKIFAFQMFREIVQPLLY